MQLLMNRTRAPEARAPSSTWNVPTTSFSKVVAGSSIDSWTEIEAARCATASTPAVHRRTRRLVADVALLERKEARVIAELGEVRDIAGDEAVHWQHGVTSLQQLPHDPAADEPGRAGHEDPHAGAASRSAA